MVTLERYQTVPSANTGHDATAVEVEPVEPPSVCVGREVQAIPLKGGPRL